MMITVTLLMINSTQEDRSYVNKEIHFFSSIFASKFINFSLNNKISANTVSYLMILSGLISLLLILVFGKSIFIFFISYIFFRIHVFLDFCDGKIALLTRTFNKKIEYFDKLVHLMLSTTFVYILFVESLSYLLLLPVISLFFFHYSKFIQKNKSHHFRKKIVLSNKIQLQTLLTNLFNIEGLLFLNLMLSIIGNIYISSLFFDYYFLIFTAYHFTVPLVKNIYS